MKLTIYAFLLILLLGTPALALAQQSILTGAHGQERYLLKSCRACHRGMKMAIRNEEKSCLSCHGNSLNRRDMVTAGYLRDSGSARLLDIEEELKKTYRHPVLTENGVHQRKELLPETLVNAARHAECVDCHEPHKVSRENPFSGIQGKRVGSFVAEITKEYELCYKCHGRSANLPAGSTDKQLEFRLTNKSYHPVEGEGANAHVISLKEPYATRKQRPGDISIISCSDCHGSENPKSPRGPHGSNYRGLLKSNYDTEDARPESSFAYELCYQCHERSSILGNESFPYHAQHILGDRGRDLPGTSCFTCHDAHGSAGNPYLIRFNLDVVESNLAGKLEYKAQGVATRHGSCALSCHGVDHEPKSY
ncbi:MAG TPA: cytochrome c3 family protein [Malonomonas sp.]